MLRSKVGPALIFPNFYHVSSVNLRLQLCATCRIPLPHTYTSRQRVTILNSRHLQYSITPLSSSVEYNWISGEERLEKYQPGGYHPVMLNDVLHKRYRIVDKIGHGGYATIWLARDEKAQRYVAVKVGLSDPSLQRPREPEILRLLQDSKSSSQAPDTGINADADTFVGRSMMHSKSSGPTESIHAILLLQLKGILEMRDSVSYFLLKLPAL